MTEKQKEKYNRMVETLRMIAREYKPVEDIKKMGHITDTESYIEALEIIYSNVRVHAQDCVLNIRKIK
jgi:hypothetical protein